jgi:hypothetical protein
MNKPAHITQSRVVFFDNLRYLFVICVILQHSSNAYNDHLTWWPVSDSSSSLIAGWLAAFLDSFTMPLLFYIAGYFAVPTMQKKGVKRFLIGKLKRLGIPWLICILTICPLVPLIYHYTRSDFTVTMGYWDLWVTLLKNAAELNVGVIVSMNELLMNNDFYQRYMWFLSLLLLFFFVFSLLYMLKKSWFEPIDEPVTSQAPGIWPTLKLLLIIGFLTAICSSCMVASMLILVPKLSNPEPFFSLGNIIQFRPSRIFLFIVYFSLGIITYKNKWIERGAFPGHMKTWTVSFTILLIAYSYIHHRMLYGPEELREPTGALFFVVLNFLTIATLGFFSSLAVRLWNHPTAFDRSLTANSYYMYLSHYIFVLVFQLILLPVAGIPGLLKFFVISVLSIIGAYIISRFLINPYPRTAIAGAFVLFLSMALLIHP